MRGFITHVIVHNKIFKVLLIRVVSSELFNIISLHYPLTDWTQILEALENIYIRRLVLGFHCFRSVAKQHCFKSLVRRTIGVYYQNNETVAASPHKLFGNVKSKLAPYSFTKWSSINFCPLIQRNCDPTSITIFTQLVTYTSGIA